MYSTMFTLQTNSKPHLLGGGGRGGGGESKSVGIARRKTLETFVPITSKNSASGSDLAGDSLVPGVAPRRNFGEHSTIVYGYFLHLYGIY